MDWWFVSRIDDIDWSRQRGVQLQPEAIQYLYTQYGMYFLDGPREVFKCSRDGV